MRLPLRFMVLAVLVTSGLGCNPGYRSVSKLEKENRGPEACDKRCGELGMKMGAFALIDTVHSGCVCLPKDAVSTPAAPSVAPAPPAQPSEAPAPVPAAPAAPAPEAAPAPAPGAMNPVITGALVAAADAMLIDQDEAKQRNQTRANAQRARAQGR
jgi:hypothetical protein